MKGSSYDDRFNLAIQWFEKGAAQVHIESAKLLLGSVDECKRVLDGDNGLLEDKEYKRVMEGPAAVDGFREWCEVVKQHPMLMSSWYSTARQVLSLSTGRDTVADYNKAEAADAKTQADRWASKGGPPAAK
jgi:hypothetical protein